jgi:hypothetical protein
MFSCVQCQGVYFLEDIKAGRYFPSTGMCLLCYQKMAESDDTCFGGMYDRKAPVCRICPDRVVCSVFVAHPHDSMRRR